PALAGASGAARSRPRVDPNLNQRQAAGGTGGGTGAELTLEKADFDAFEARLGDVQNAYGRNDINALGDRTTPEMLSYFAEELAANTSKGVRNEVSAPKLLQGDLAEAWREAGGEYASVAMRYAVIDVEVDVASGRVVSGSRTEPVEVTEIWTFRRGKGEKAEDWVLSAIQQA
ncbi:MAG: TIM44-like domain-containing protein, partial [Hyphomicrobium sp.]